MARVERFEPNWYHCFSLAKSRVFAWKQASSIGNPGGWVAVWIGQRRYWYPPPAQTQAISLRDLPGNQVVPRIACLRTVVGVDLPRCLRDAADLPDGGLNVRELEEARVRPVAHGADRARRRGDGVGLEAPTRVATADAARRPDGRLARVLPRVVGVDVDWRIL